MICDGVVALQRRRDSATSEQSLTTAKNQFGEKDVLEEEND